MTAKKVFTIVAVSLILVIVLVSAVNVGVSLFYDKPVYEDFL